MKSPWSSGRIVSWRRLAWCGLFVVLAVGKTRAEDVVRFTTPQNPEVVLRLTGTILDFTGRQLDMQTTAGAKRTIPASHVVDVERPRSAEEQGADERFARREFPAALTAYQTALRGEPRVWVRRRLLAQMVRAASAQDQVILAGESFLALFQSDPETSDFGSIPLAWLPGELGLGVEAKAREWLSRDAQPVAVLLGASYLLLSPQGAAAEAKLRSLSTHADRRVAALAEAQRWRLKLANVTSEELDDWARQVERYPFEARAGAYYLLGRGLAQRGRSEEAVLAWLHVPLLFDTERRLASESLLHAAGTLRRLERVDESERLVRELLAEYGETRAAREWQQTGGAVLGRP